MYTRTAVDHNPLQHDYSFRMARERRIATKNVRFSLKSGYAAPKALGNCDGASVYRCAISKTRISVATLGLNARQPHSDEQNGPCPPSSDKTPHGLDGTGVQVRLLSLAGRLLFKTRAGAFS